MRRRDFIRAVAGSAVAWPLASTAQQSAMPVVGYFGSETPERFATRLSAFRQGLSATGFDEGRNVAIEYRWGNGQIDRFPALAADLVRRKVSVIATPGSGVAALAAKAATTTIPVVFETGLDPVAVGLVKSLNRPEGNVTGITSLNVDRCSERTGTAARTGPQSQKFCRAREPGQSCKHRHQFEKSGGPARARGLQLHVLNASTERDFDSAFAKLVQLQAGGLVIAADIIFNSRATTACRSDTQARSASSPYGARVRRGRRIGELRWRYQGNAQASRHLHWPHPQG